MARNYFVNFKRDITFKNTYINEFILYTRICRTYD